MDNFIQQFLSALANGQESLLSFEKSWFSLLKDITDISHRGTIGSETLNLAHSIASSVASIAKCYLDLERKQEELKAELLDDVEQMLHDMTRLNLSSPPSPRSAIADESSPHFIAPAYQWLLQNIHNPYPSTEVKRTFARTSNCSPSAVNSWFVNVRRRMGWTALCRDHFHNCRAEAADAAYRALVKEDPQRKLSANLVQAFVTMKVTAEGLYSSTFTKSSLAGDLDMVVRDMTQEDRRLVEETKRREAEEAGIAKARQKGIRRMQRMSERRRQKDSECYPSPQRSHTSSPLSNVDGSLTNESEEDEDFVPRITACNKRRSLPADVPNSPMLEGRPLKRLRSTAVPPCVPDLSVSLPSPSSTASSVVESSNDDLLTRDTTSALPVCSDVTQRTSRKRRLSDAEVNGLPKRPRGLCAGPRLYAVSDPLPKSSLASEPGVDDWFNSNFDSLFSLPPPVDSGEPDNSTPLEVELFSNYCLPQDLHKDTLSLSAFDPENHAYHSTGSMSDSVEFDNFMQAIAGNGLETAPGIAGLPATTSTMTLHTDSISSHENISNSSLGSVDWALLLNSTDNLTVGVVDTILTSSYDTSASNHHSLPEIDLSMLQLPQVLPSHDSHPTLALDSSSKELKLKKLQAMQEVVKQMEKEILQSDGFTG